MNIAKRAFVTTIPVLVGYVFVGIAFGLLLFNTGYNFVWALAISTFVYAGSGQFMLVSLLGSNAPLITVFLMTFAINCRHIFYGISFIEKFEWLKPFKNYMIFSLTDETYSLLCLEKWEEETPKRYYVFIALFNQLYWVIGTLIGSLIGEMITFNSKGIDFAMTALFVVIFIEQFISARSKVPAFIGLSCGIVCLLIFGGGTFVLPALLSSVTLMVVLKKRIEVGQ